MSLYPSLEDMKVDQLIKTQMQLESSVANQAQKPGAAPSAPRLSELIDGNSFSNYPSLREYMGLELTHDVIAANMPEYLDCSSHNQMKKYTGGNFQMQLTERSNYPVIPVDSGQNLVAPLSGHSLGLRSYVTNGIRELTLCKGGDGKIGLRVESINNGIFVNLVRKNSPAAMAGVRFGDQILEINGKNVAGLSSDAVHDMLKKAPNNGISVVVRDRPFERTITLHKDSMGFVGFSFKDGKVIALVVGSSAAKNGLLTEHNLLEVNGQNVVGLKDKEITKIISEGGDVITVTVVPSFIYQHMTKRMSSSLLKNLMDHTAPTY